MDSTVLAETEAFIVRQREAFLNQRQELLNQQNAIQEQLERWMRCSRHSTYSRANTRNVAEPGKRAHGARQARKQA